MDVAIRVAADGFLIIILIVGASALIRGIPRKQWLKKVPLAVMAGLTGLLIGKLISLLYQPNVARPFIEAGTVPGAAYIDNPGFPSDHALLASVVVLAVYFLTPYKKLSITLLILTIIMSSARVVAQVHTPLDIVGGMTAAAVGATWYATRKR